MNLRTLLYYIFSKNKLPLYLNDSGHVVEGDGNYAKADGQPAHLRIDPAGWDKMLVKYARNIKYWGVFRDMTVPMTFSADGFEILRYIMWTYGMEYVATIGIAKLDRTILPYNYYSWYVSELNLAKYKETNNEVQVEALEGGMSKYLKANESVAYKIPINEDIQKKSVYMDGMELDNTATFSVTDGVSIDLNINFGNHIVNLAVVQKEVQDIGGAFDVPRTKIANNNVTIGQTGKYFFKATASGGQIELSWDFTLDVNFTPPPDINPGAEIFCVIRRLDANSFSNFQLTLLHRTKVQGIPGSYHLIGSGIVPVNIGDSLYLYTFMNVEGATGDIQTSFVYSGAEPFLKMVYTFRFSPSSVEGITPLRLGEQLVSKMSNGQYKLKSKFLKSFDASMLMVSGDSLRGLKGSFITISWNDFFQSFNRYGIFVGIAPTGELTVEKFEDSFTDDVILDLGEVSNVTTSPAEDLIFNSMKVGYKAQEYQEVNGKHEINQGQVWTCPITKVVKELDLTSVIRADALGAEIMRINFAKKLTTDSNSDNDTWFINTARSYGSFNLDIVEFRHERGYNYFVIAHAIDTITKFGAGNTVDITQTNLNNGTFTIYNVFQVNSDTYYVFVNETFVPEITFAQFGITYLILNRPAYTNVVGILHPATAYNIELSPKRSILENGSFIHSIMDKYLDGQSIVLQSADKNTDLSTTLNGITISEDEPISIGKMKKQIFRPYYHEFSTDSNIKLLQIMEINPYGKVKWATNGNNFYGFMFDGGLNPAILDRQNWKLLSAPENDLTKLNG